MRTLPALLLAVLAATLVLLPAPSRAGDYCRSRYIYGHCAPTYYAPSYYAPTYSPAVHCDNDYCYTWHAEEWSGGRWWPAGYYTHLSNGWYLKGYGIIYGFPGPEAYYRSVRGYAPSYPTYFDPQAYFSVRDYYRDALLSDSIALKVLLGRSAVGAYPDQPLPAAGAPAQGPPRRDVAPQPPAAAPPTMPRAGASATTPVDPEIQQYVSATCLSCHGADNPKKGVNLTRLDSLETGKRWAVYAMVNSGEMPEGGSPAKDEIVKKLYAWAKAGSAAAR